jgi:hypothetical protein
VVCPGAALDYFPREGWGGEPCMVCDAHMYLLQFHAGSFGAGSWGKVVLLFSMQHGVGRLSMG